MKESPGWVIMETTSAAAASQCIQYVTANFAMITQTGEDDDADKASRSSGCAKSNDGGGGGWKLIIMACMAAREMQTDSQLNL